MARSHFSYEKRRKELEKKKKKEAKRLAKAERKAARAAGEEIVEPKIEIDEMGNVVEIWPEGYDSNGNKIKTAEDEESDGDEEDPA